MCFVAFSRSSQCKKQKQKKKIYCLGNCLKHRYAALIYNCILFASFNWRLIHAKKSLKISGKTCSATISTPSKSLSCEQFKLVTAANKLISILALQSSYLYILSHLCYRCFSSWIGIKKCFISMLYALKLLLVKRENVLQLSFMSLLAQNFVKV